MVYDHAISEIIGAIALMGIIVAAFGIFSAIYLPMIKPTQIPQVKLSVACSENINNFDSEFPCTQGSFSCHPINDPFDSQTCEEDCKLRDYSKNQQYQSGDSSSEVLRCMEHCLAPMCSNLAECGVIYICHNGGDSLDIDSMKILVNGLNVESTKWEKKEISSNEFKPYNSYDKNFSIGTVLRIQNPPSPVDRVMVVYNLPSENEITLVLNQFGTDVN